MIAVLGWIVATTVVVVFFMGAAASWRQQARALEPRRYDPPRDEASR